MKNKTLEYLEIIDEDNNPLGIKKEKKLVHGDGDWHRTTQIWIIDQEKKLLLNKRAWYKQQDPGKWSSYFGGHVQFGEGYDQTAIRELKEELGISVEAKKLKKLNISKNPIPKEFVQRYLLIIDNNLKLIPSNEFTTIRWYELGKLLKWANREPLIFSGGMEYIKEQISWLERMG